MEAGATLHVYTNLLQIPVLILSGKRQALPPIEPSRFLLHIDNNVGIRPRVRVEGEDPITLAVLIDGAPLGPRLPQLADGLAAMAHERLHAQDRIAFYGFDGCKLRRTLLLSTPNAAAIHTAVQALQAYPAFQQRWFGAKCAAPVGLWDALAWTAQSLKDETGRRVVLVVTNGEDSDSKLDANAARMTATNSGVAIFALAERNMVRSEPLSHAFFADGSVASALAFVTEGSGGMVLETPRNNLPGTLLRFPDLLRGRYIVEFSRPPGMTSGAHSLTVSVGQPKIFIRNAGTSMPTYDPVERDPTVLRGRPGDLPPDLAEAPIADSSQQRPEPPQVAPAVVSPTPSASVPPIVPLQPVQSAAPPPQRTVDPLDITDEVQRANPEPR